MTGAAKIRIVPLPADFADWTGLLALISTAFAFMDAIIDPPSSAKDLSMQSLTDKAKHETCFIARDGDRLVGCIFASERPNYVYIGKLAIAPSHQKQAIGRALLQAVEDHARAIRKTTLELQTRVELTGNQAAFRRLGFREILRTAHAGYDRPTSITMRKSL